MIPCAEKLKDFIFSFVVLACYGKAKMEIRNETCFKIKAADETRILDCLSVKRISMRKLKKVMAYMLFVCLNMVLDQNLRVHKVV